MFSALKVQNSSNGSKRTSGILVAFQEWLPFRCLEAPIDLKNRLCSVSSALDLNVLLVPLPVWLCSPVTVGSTANTLRSGATCISISDNLVPYYGTVAR